MAGEDVSRFVPVETDATGHGISRDAAVSNALTNALAQETGVDAGKISLSGSLDVQAHGTDTTTKTGGQAETARRWTGTVPAGPETTSRALTFAGEDASSRTVTFAGGTVESYKILGLDPAPGGGFNAHIHAVLKLARRAGGAGVTRRRLAVAAFTDAAGDATAAALHDSLVMALTQTRRFAVVDRSHDADYESEMSVIQAQAGAAEQARASQVLGADYILTGKLHVTGGKITGHAAQTTSQRLELTGEIVSTTTPATLRHTAGASDADFELIETATRQIVLADHLTVSGTSMAAVAARIAANIVGAIYPPRLVSIASPTALVVNQGGDAMHRGERFRLMQTGQDMIDPYTHESLGPTEQQIGIIEIDDVQPRLSYAHMVTGQLPATASLALLRPESTLPRATATPVRGRPTKRPSAPSPIPTGPDRGVYLPFDR